MPSITETIYVEGMTCSHCIKAVRHAVEVTPGVVVHDVELGNVEVIYEPEFVTREQIEASIEGAGYKVKK